MTNTHDEWIWTDTGGFQKNPHYVAPAPVDHLALLRQCGEALVRVTARADEAMSCLPASARASAQAGGGFAFPLDNDTVMEARAALEALRKAGVEC